MTTLNLLNAWPIQLGVADEGSVLLQSPGTQSMLLVPNNCWESSVEGTAHKARPSVNALTAHACIIAEHMDGPIESM